MENIYNRISEIVYINLENAPERKNRIEQYLKIFKNKNITRYNAINKVTIHDSNNKCIWLNRLPNHYKDKNGNFKYEFSGIIGCYMSHYRVLEQLNEKYKEYKKYDSSIENNNDNILKKDPLYLILEDDCIFDERIINLLRLPEFNKNIPQDWTILKPLHGNNSKNDKINKFFYDVTNSNNKKWFYYYGAHFQIINPSKIPLILNILDKLLIGNIDINIKDNVPGIFCFGGNYIRQDNYISSERDPKTFKK